MFAEYGPISYASASRIQLPSKVTVVLFKVKLLFYCIEIPSLFTLYVSIELYAEIPHVYVNMYKEFLYNVAVFYVTFLNYCSISIIY